MTIAPSHTGAWFLAHSVHTAVETEVLMALTVAAVGITLAGAALVFAFRRAKGTTLRAPLCWAAISLTSLIVIEGLQLRYRASDAVRTKWDFIGATSTLCPFIALLGAKRPQNRAWQLIVAALWGIVSLPAVESLIVHPQDPLELHSVWQVFIGLLILVGCINYLLTRFAISAMLVAAGQCVLLGGLLFNSASCALAIQLNVFSVIPILSLDGKTLDLRVWLIVAGILPQAAAICIAYAFAGKPPSKNAISLDGWNMVWRDFRNNFGFLWAARVIDRYNAMALAVNTLVRLNWLGFYRVPAVVGAVATAESEPAASPADRWTDTLGPLEPGMRNLLRRFVCDQWIDARLGNHAKPGTDV